MQLQGLPAGNRTRVLWITRPVARGNVVEKHWANNYLSYRSKRVWTLSQSELRSIWRSYIVWWPPKIYPTWFNLSSIQVRFEKVFILVSDQSQTRVLVVQWLAHVLFTSVTRVRFLLSAVIRLKFHLGRMWEECFQFDSAKHAGFLWILRFPPVQTLDQ